jgi:hypothetical protein
MRSCLSAGPIWIARQQGRESIPAVIRSMPSRNCGKPDLAGALELGGAVTYTEALHSSTSIFRHCRARAAHGWRQIGNLGTVAGNLATASPIGDTSLPDRARRDGTLGRATVTAPCRSSPSLRDIVRPPVAG